MEIIQCGAIDSTSSYAAQLLQQGRKPPFAVWATSQTAGRGRRGHLWESPEGNLFLTIALSPDQALLGEGGVALGTLPLKAAILVAQVIEKHTGLRPTLKWPNDILFCGRKLGGLLLEMSSAGGQPSSVLMGIGLNLNVTPSFKGPYAATSLAALLERPQNVSFWVQEVVRVVDTAWHHLPLDQVPLAFENYGIAPGALWREMATDQFYRSQPVGHDGSLTLQALADQKERCLTSVDHGFRWLYQGEGPIPLVLADVGNSRLKLAVYGHVEAREPSQLFECAVDREEEALGAALKQIRRDYHIPPLWPIHILSVNPVGAQGLSELAISLEWTPLTITKRAVRRWGFGYDPQSLGIDRMAAIEGYLARQSHVDEAVGENQAVIVSAGTATTIDVVGISGEHFGGWILPGLKTSLKSLRQSTQLLPLLEPAPKTRLDLGHSTAEAMEQGVLNMTIGAIHQATKILDGGDRIPKSVILTGGGASLLAPHLEAKWISDLVMEGARQMVLAGA